MKKLIILLFTILTIPLINANALVEKSNDIYLTDEANIVKEETKNYILTSSNFLHEKRKIDYYVVTVKSLEGIDKDEYINYIYKSFNISEKGIIILISKGDRLINIKVGTSLSNIITNEIIDEYIKEYFMPNFKNDEWDKGLKNGYSAFYKYICNNFNINSEDITVYRNDDILVKYKVPIIFIIIWICTIIGYVLSTYFKRIYNNEKLDMFDYVIFPISIFINIILLNITFEIKPLLIIVVLGFELVAITSNLTNEKESTKKKRNKRRKK